MSSGTLKLIPVTVEPIDQEQLVRRHQVGVWRYLRALGASRDVAEDLLQDVFLIAFDKLADDRSHAATAAFLRGIARNLLLRAWRDRGRREALIVELADRAWQEDCAADDGDRWLEALERCVEGLDDRSQQVVQLFYREARSRADVAHELGIKENGLKTLLQRLRASLRHCVERRLGGGER